MCAVNSEGLSDRFLDYAASIIIIAKIRDRIICDKSGVLKLYQINFDYFAQREL